MNKIESYKYQKYQGMFCKMGVIDDSDHGMHWMDDDYIWGTFKQATENVSLYIFVKEIIDLFSIDMPYIPNLITQIGVFDKVEEIYYSKEIFNRNIQSIKIYHKHKFIIFIVETFESIGKVIIDDINKYIIKKNKIDVYEIKTFNKHKILYLFHQKQFVILAFQ